MRRWLKYSALLLLILIVAFGGYIASSGSKALVHPNRRALQDYHHDILAHQADRGNVLAKGGNDLYADIAGFFLEHLPAP